MKKILFALLFFYSTQVFSQNLIHADVNRFSPEFTVLEFKGKKADELYNSLLKWVNLTFKNPNYVIKSDIKNELIRINGIWSITAKAMIGTKTIDLEYIAQFDIKDEKIRFSIFNLETRQKEGSFHYNNLFKSSGERKTFKEAQNFLTEIDLIANSFIANLVNNINKEKTDW